MFISIEILLAIISLFALNFILSSLKLTKIKTDFKTNSNSSRIESMDFIKGISIIFIVLIHSSVSLLAHSMINEILWVAIPAFFTVTGFLLTNKFNSQPNGVGSFLDYTMAIFKRVVLIYLLFTIAGGVFQRNAFIFDEFVKDFVLGRINSNYYFIPIILQFYLLFPLLYKYKDRIQTIHFLIVSFVLSLFFHTLNYQLQTPNWNSNPWSLVFFGRYFVSVVFGIYLAKYDLTKITLLKLTPFFICFIMTAIIMSHEADKLYMTFLYQLAFILLLLVVFSFFTKNVFFKATFILLGRNTLIIYLVHTYVQYKFLAFIFSENNLESMLLISFYNLLISLFIAIIFNKAYNYCLEVITQRIKTMKLEYAKMLPDKLTNGSINKKSQDNV